MCSYVFTSIPIIHYYVLTEVAIDSVFTKSLLAQIMLLMFENILYSLQDCKSKFWFVDIK